MQLNKALLQLDAAQKSLTNSMQQLDVAEAFLKTSEAKVRTLTTQRNIAVVVAIAGAIVAGLSFLW